MGVEEELQGLEEGLLDPATRRDRVRAGELLAEEFIEFGSSGRVWQRAEILTAMAEESGQERRWLEDFRLQELAGEVVLVTYRALREDGQGRRVTLRSSVWVRRSGRWLMVFHQGTAMG